jgi:hypothetical protein
MHRDGIGNTWGNGSQHGAIKSMKSILIQDIADGVGHKSTHVTETVYRHVIVPAIRGGATVMDDIFGTEAAPKTSAG